MDGIAYAAWLIAAEEEDKAKGDAAAVTGSVQVVIGHGPRGPLPPPPPGAEDIAP